MADRKYGRMFTMSDVAKILEYAEMGDENDVARLINEMDNEGVRFKFDKDEPTFTLRAHDQRAIAAIRYYGDHQSPNAPQGFLDGIEAAFADFDRYRHEHTEKMKQPD